MDTITWRMAFAYAVVLVALAASAIAHVTTEANAAPKAPATGVPSCKTEDATRWCYWDATKQGNGKGRSFLSLPGGGRIYVDKVID